MLIFKSRHLDKWMCILILIEVFVLGGCCGQVMERDASSGGTSTTCAKPSSKQEGDFVPFNADNPIGAYVGHESYWGTELIAQKKAPERLGQLFEYRMYSQIRWTGNRQAGRNLHFTNEPFGRVQYGPEGDISEEEMDSKLDALRISLIDALDNGSVVELNSVTIIAAAAYSEASFIVDNAHDYEINSIWLATIQLTHIFVIEDEGKPDQVTELLVVLPQYNGDSLFVLDRDAARKVMSITSQLYVEFE